MDEMRLNAIQDSLAGGGTISRDACRWLVVVLRETQEISEERWKRIRDLSDENHALREERPDQAKIVDLQKSLDMADTINDEYFKRAVKAEAVSNRLKQAMSANGWAKWEIEQVLKNV